MSGGDCSDGDKGLNLICAVILLIYCTYKINRAYKKWDVMLVTPEKILLGVRIAWAGCNIPISVTQGISICLIIVMITFNHKIKASRVLWNSHSHSTVSNSTLENVESILKDFKVVVVEEGLKAGQKEIAELKKSVVGLDEKITVGK
jgi:hypothetical protein